MSAIVAATHCSTAHTFTKQAEPKIELVAGLGVQGDAHQGALVQHRSRVAVDPTQPNLRQVHLIHAELFDCVRTKGFDIGPGDLGENITTSGIELLDLPVGSILKIGPEALVAVTGLRNPCKQINQFQNGLLGAVLDRTTGGALVRLAGIMAVVVAGGAVWATDDTSAVHRHGPPAK